MRTLLIAFSLSLTACASTAAEGHADATAGDVARTDANTNVDAANADVSITCDPHRAPCRVTLTCADLERCEALTLANGQVVVYDHATITRPGDLRVDIGRYLLLTSSSNVCRFGASPGTSTTSFASLADVPADPSRCAWDQGPNLLCGVNTSAYEPTCAGDGLLVRDAAAQLYRLRVVADRHDATGWHADVELSAVDP